VSEGPSDNSTGDRPADHTGAGADAHPQVTGLMLLDVGWYAAARLLLVAALTGVIYLAARLLGVTEFPIVVAALFALIIGMPLGIWLFGRLRRRATAALAIVGERRRAEREQLQARLRGETVLHSRPDDGADNGPDAGSDGR
jgi:small-conductance mechanosensitive channel